MQLVRTIRGLRSPDGLREQGVSVALFNPRLIPRWVPALNLRNHRKILVVDGVLGFTGGFNIKREYWSLEADTRPFRDMHFQLTGPVVAHLSETFVKRLAIYHR